MGEPPGVRVRGLCVGGGARVWRVGAVLLLVLLLAVLLATRADAQPQIKVSCNVYATNRVDPIALSKHLHHQIGNTSTTNASTGDSLFNNTGTSCNMPWLTSAGWFPVEMDEPVQGGQRILPYAGSPDEDKGHPQGLAVPRHGSVVNCCNGAPGNAVPFQATPRYGCTENWATSVTFADCWNRLSSKNG